MYVCILVLMLYINVTRTYTYTDICLHAFMCVIIFHVNIFVNFPFIYHRSGPFWLALHLIFFCTCPLLRLSAVPLELNSVYVFSSMHRDNA